MTNEEILRTFMDLVWNKKDMETVERFVHPEYTIYADTGDRYEGMTLDHAMYKERLKDSFIPFPDMHFEILSAISDGDYVAINWIMTGTNLGKTGEMPPTGRPIRTMGMTQYHFNNGRVCGHSQVFDRTTVMKQLGFIR